MFRTLARVRATRPRPEGAIYLSLAPAFLLCTCQYIYNIIIKSIPRLIRNRGITDFIFYLNIRKLIKISVDLLQMREPTVFYEVCNMRGV
jgi:hypothetical protein